MASHDRIEQILDQFVQNFMLQFKQDMTTVLHEQREALHAKPDANQLDQTHVATEIMELEYDLDNGVVEFEEETSFQTQLQTQPDDDSFVHEVGYHKLLAKLKDSSQPIHQSCELLIHGKVTSLSHNDLPSPGLSTRTAIGEIGTNEKEFHVANKVFDKMPERDGYIPALNPKPPDDYGQFIHGGINAAAPVGDFGHEVTAIRFDGKVYCETVGDDGLPHEHYRFKVAYDKLVIATGSEPLTFGHVFPQCVFDHRDMMSSLHPLLLVIAGDEDDKSSMDQNSRQSSGGGTIIHGTLESQSGNSHNSSTIIQFYSFISNCYVQVLRFRSVVFMVRCSPLIIVVCLDAIIHCFNALTFEIKFSGPMYHVPQFGEQGTVEVNTGCSPLAVGPRWLAYASDNPLVLNTGRLSPKNFTPTSISLSTSPGNGGSLMTCYALESNPQLAFGILNWGDIGYKTLSRYCPELLPDGSNSPIPSNSGWRAMLAASDTDYGGMVVVSDFVFGAFRSQLRARTSPISALCFGPTSILLLLVYVSVHGNNINIFPIMPSRTCSESNNRSYQWIIQHYSIWSSGNLLHWEIFVEVVTELKLEMELGEDAIIEQFGEVEKLLWGIILLSTYGEENSWYNIITPGTMREHGIFAAHQLSTDHKPELLMESNMGAKKFLVLL